jgi:hypothetical protein
MIILTGILLVAAPGYGDLEPFMDEAPAGRAFEVHLQCLGHATFKRKGDAREPAIVAAEVVEVCSQEGATLRAALADVYRRKPSLIDAGEDAGTAADRYLEGVRGRAEDAISKFRNGEK